jgi:hypothetical protein
MRANADGERASDGNAGFPPWTSKAEARSIETLNLLAEAGSTQFDALAERLRWESPWPASGSGSSWSHGSPGFRIETYGRPHADVGVGVVRLAVRPTVDLLVCEHGALKFRHDAAHRQPVGLPPWSVPLSRGSGGWRHSHRVKGSLEAAGACEVSMVFAGRNHESTRDRGPRQSAAGSIVWYRQGTCYLLQ